MIEVLRRFAPSLVLSLLGIGLVQLVREVPALSLLVAILTLPGLVVLAYDQPLARNRSWPQASFVLALTCAFLVFTTSRIVDVEVLKLAAWLLGPVGFAALGLLLGRLVRIEQAGKLLALAIPSLVVFLPFLADPWFMSKLGQEEQRLGIAFLVNNSTWAAACADLLSVDLFKNELLYREFRIGEQLYGFPELREALKSQSLLAAGLLLLGSLFWGLRSLSKRLLPASP